jgi:hypothetical protein
VKLHADDPQFFLYMDLALAEVDMLKFCSQLLAENISSLKKLLNFVLLLPFHATSCVFKIWRKTQLRNVAASGIIKNVYLPRLSEVLTIKLNCKLVVGFMCSCIFSFMFRVM